MRKKKKKKKCLKFQIAKNSIYFFLQGTYLCLLPDFLAKSKLRFCQKKKKYPVKDFEEKKKQRKERNKKIYRELELWSGHFRQIRARKLETRCEGLIIKRSRSNPIASFFVIHIGNHGRNYRVFLVHWLSLRLWTGQTFSPKLRLEISWLSERWSKKRLLSQKNTKKKKTTTKKKKTNRIIDFISMSNWPRWGESFSQSYFQNRWLLSWYEQSGHIPDIWAQTMGCYREMVTWNVSGKLLHWPIVALTVNFTLDRFQG